MKTEPAGWVRESAIIAGAACLCLAVSLATVSLARQSIATPGILAGWAAGLLQYLPAPLIYRRAATRGAHALILYGLNTQFLRLLLLILLIIHVNRTGAVESEAFMTAAIITWLGLMIVEIRFLLRLVYRGNLG